MGEKIESYDISPKQREIIEWRRARRLKLRQEYLKQIHNPIKQEMIMDEQFQRYALMRLTHEYQAKLTGRSTVLGLGGLFATIAISAYLVKVVKDNEEHKLRTGQVSYADREFKFQ